MSVPYETRANWSWPDSTEDILKDERDSASAPGAFAEAVPEGDVETSSEDFEQHTSQSFPFHQGGDWTSFGALRLEIFLGFVTGVLHP